CKHAVYVGPDLDFLCADARTDDGRGVVRSSTSKRRRDAVFRGCNEAAHHDDLMLQNWHQCFPNPAIGLLERWSSLRMTPVSNDDAAGINVRGFHTAPAQFGFDDQAGDTFAVGGD